MKRLIGDLILIIGITLGASMIAVAIVDSRHCTKGPAPTAAIRSFDVRAF